MRQVLRFYEQDMSGQLTELYETQSLAIPHMGSDIVIFDKRYFVIDVLITYFEDLTTQVDITCERVYE